MADKSPEASRASEHHGYRYSTTATEQELHLLLYYIKLHAVAFTFGFPWHLQVPVSV